jgi:amidophosphoribosyltransferase
VIIHLIARSKARGIVDRLIEALKRVSGAYSLLVLTPDKLVAVRDPHGFRPLVLGKLKNSLVVSSETCALDLIEAEYLREVDPGEMVIIDKDGLKSLHPFEKVTPRPCIFEHIYFARPDSLVFGENVYEIRFELGRQLARECPVRADVVIPVPDSGVPAALGFSEESGIPFAFGIIRNHYVGRTFIEPEQSIRHFGVKVKLNAVKGVIEGKRVVLVDDSIVRGTTSRKIVKMVRDAGAKEVHLRISAPPTTHSCFYGIDTPTRKELIASNHSVEEINTFITSDTLGYLSLDGLYNRLGIQKKPFCDACFSGDYPVAIGSEEKPRKILPFVQRK